MSLDPALEFLKFVCFVLHYDTVIEDEIHKLKKVMKRGPKPLLLFPNLAIVVVFLGIGFAEAG